MIIINKYPNYYNRIWNMMKYYTIPTDIIYYVLYSWFVVIH